MNALRRLTLLLALLGLLSVAAGASELSREFEQRMQSVASAEEALPVINEYLDRMSELEDWRVLQNYWMRADKEACQAFFTAKHAEQPDSPDFHYLWLRNLDDSLAQLRGSRELIARSPEFYWGYRIFSATYSQALVDTEAAEELREDMRANRSSDLALLKRGLIRFPQDDYLAVALYHHYYAQEEYDQAEGYLLRLSDPGAIESNFENVMDFAAKAKRSRPFEVLFPKLLAQSVSRGEISPEDSLGYYQTYYLQVLSLTGEWPKLQRYFQDNPELARQDGTLPNRIELYIGLKEYETALNLLEGAMAAKVVDYPSAEADPAYEPLRALPRWPEVMRLAEENWRQDSASRRDDALALKTSKPAPLWELSDQEGNLVRLEDLRGKIVVLDFWATWCNPCLKTMPLLDAWTKANSAEDLAVFSINTWDKSTPREEVIDFMRQNDYSMTLLFGNDELPEAYGFDGIPYICVIDRAGNIAFEHSGYSSDLPESLDFWLQDLRR